MSFKLPLSRSTKIIQIGISSEYQMTNASSSSIYNPNTGVPNVIPLDTISGDSGHSVSLNTSTSEITLGVNKHYMGLGFFACQVSTSTRTNEGFHIGAFDSSLNLYDITDGFLSNTAANTFYGSDLNEYDGDTFNPYGWSYNSTPNETFKFQKSVGSSSFSFRMAISSIKITKVKTDSVIYILEMD